MILLTSMLALATAQSGDLVSMASRGAGGQLVVRAHRLANRIAVDGRLDESIYQQYQPAGGFVQVEPAYGEPATENTEVWVFFDDRAVYVAFRCSDSGMDRWASLICGATALVSGRRKVCPSDSIRFTTGETVSSSA